MSDYLMIELIQIDTEPGYYFTKNCQLADYNKLKQQAEQIRAADGVATIEVSTYTSWVNYLSQNEIVQDGLRKNN